MASEERSLKIAVLIDFDNIEIGVKTTLNREFDVGAVLDAVKERGEVVTKVAYGDWKRVGDYSRLLTQHAVRMVQRNMTPGGDKNGADINLALDALEMAFTHAHINAFVIVGGDSDFISLVEKLKQYDRKVFVVGGRQFTAMVLQKNCTEFIAYENLIRQPSRRAAGVSQNRDRQAAAQPSSSHLQAAPVAKAFPLVTRALQLLTDREVTPQLGLLKSTLLQLDSTFSERDYGTSSFRDFADKLAEAGLVTLKSAGRSVLVELRESDGAAGAEMTESAPAEPEAAQAGTVAVDTEAPPVAAPETPQPQTSIIDGIQLLHRVLQTPGAIPRWPMYIRNVKQAMRAVDPNFDERRHGNLVEILRAVQRDGVVRMERDRQGVLRVFQGPQLRPVQAPPGSGDMTDVQAATMAGGGVTGDPNSRSVVDGDAPAALAADSVRAPALETTAPSEDEGQMSDVAVQAAAPESAGAKPRRRRKSDAAAPKDKTTAPRKPRTRTATPRKRKEPATE
ncbi:MAG: NYN domain-containing protein [Acidobacteria bacterium]|nr:NYN domain-containing protein [Acidobacteriota bacterium]